MEYGNSEIAVSDPEFRRLHEEHRNHEERLHELADKVPALRGRGARGETPEEREAPSQGPHGSHRPSPPRGGPQLRIPIAREGWAFIVPPLAAGGVAGLTGHPLAAAFWAPPRSSCSSSSATRSARPRAATRRSSPPPTAPCSRSPRPRRLRPARARRLSIFMSVFNCHVNRAPVSGPSRRLRLRAAGSKDGGVRREGLDRERAEPHHARRPAAGSITFKQIAGALARRIVFYPRVGDELARGQRIGLIRFGSRVDLFVPDGAEVLVGPGDKLKAGRTAIARWPGGA